MVEQFKRERFADEATAWRCLEQAAWDLVEAMKSYMPPAPDSPMSGRTLASSNFEAGYDTVRQACRRGRCSSAEP
jgi:hypothetical protein